MKKIIQIMLMLIFLLNFFVSLGHAETSDIMNYKSAFIVLNKIEYNLTLSQSYELFALVIAAEEDAEIISLKTKMQVTLELRLSLKEIYKVKSLLVVASDTVNILVLRTQVDLIITSFKSKLAEFKTEVDKNKTFITKAEGIIVEEEE